jgi:hypothetical protein
MVESCELRGRQRPEVRKEANIPTPTAQLRSIREQASKSERRTSHILLMLVIEIVFDLGAHAG